MLVCIFVEFAEICCCVTVSGCVSMLVMLLNVVGFLSLGVCGWMSVCVVGVLGVVLSV